MCPGAGRNASIILEETAPLWPLDTDLFCLLINSGILGILENKIALMKRSSKTF